jgi:carboxypeptidase Q
MAPCISRTLSRAVVLFGLCILCADVQAQRRPSQLPSPDETNPPLPAQPPTTPSDDPIARIRDEGLNHSQVMQTLSYLTDVIGPRLTGSPNLHRANEWTRDKLSEWGLDNAHLEPWGPFGRGWSVKRFSMQVIEPQSITVIAYPKAWSPGLKETVEADLVFVNAETEADLQKYEGTLKGKIVLWGPPRTVRAHFEALGVRMTDGDLLYYANSTGGPVAPAVAPTRRAGQELLQPQNGPTTRPLAGAVRPSDSAGARPQNNVPPMPVATQPAQTQPARGLQPLRQLSFLQKEGVAAIVTPSQQGDGGTMFVQAALVPGQDGPRGFTGPRPWSPEAPALANQIVMAAEDYNRLVRMIQQGVKPKVSLQFEAEFHDQDLMAYNTIAEIPGTDLKDQIVMLGGHMDSWHSGTGATDNGAGVAVAMEAVRILQTQGFHPRRTIRVALWTGEEEGMLGSAAYVKEHFGYFPDNAAAGGRGGRGARGRGGLLSTQPATNPTTRPVSQLVKKDEYDKLSAYFNLDNGTGRVRGIFMQGNDATASIFRKWLAPFRDMGAATLSMANTGSTDHMSFDDIGLPGFQFIQDPVEYMSRTHHSNEDVFDRIQADDLKQASVIMAGFVYDAAMAEQMMPRKPLAARANTGGFRRGGGRQNGAPATQPITQNN